MATRLYFSKETAAGVTPSGWSAGWNKTTGVGTDREISTRKQIDTSGLESITNAGVGTSGQFTALFRCVSPPMQAQTLSGSLKGQMLCSEAASGDNYTIALAVKVIQSGGSDRGVLVAVSASDDTSTTPPELNTTNENRKFRDSSEAASFSFSDLAVSSGDRIVVEVGFRQASSSTNLGGAFRGNTAASDLGENDTDITGLPWIEFTGTIAFDTTYFNSASTPADSASATGTADPTAVTPPSGMLAGDLVCMIGQQRATSATLAISAAGGQTWTSETVFDATTNVTARLFWCQFNGTWSTNPSVDFSATTCNSVQMHVFRPPATNYTWQKATLTGSLTDNPSTANDLTSPFTALTSGSDTTTSNPTVSLAGWHSADDNTWGTLSGSGWAVTGSAQYRNTSGQDQSASYAHKIQTAAGTLGDVSKSQLTLGDDLSTWWVATFEAVPPSVPVEKTNVFSIARFKPWLPQLNLALRQNIAADFTTAQTQPSTPVHFIGKFKPTTLLQQRGLWLSSAADVPPVIEPSTPVNFIAKFRPTEIWQLRDLRLHEAQDNSAPQTQPETNTHFIAKFKPDRLNLLNLLRHNIAADFTSTVAFATNVHFIGKFSPYRYSLNQQLRQNIAADNSFAQTQAETNTHFIARFKPYQFNLLPDLRYETAFEPQAFEVETNTHFIAKFAPYRLNLAVSLRQNIAADDSTAQTQAETNTHFLGKFQPSRLLLQRDLLLHEAQDTSFFEQSTPPHFIAKFQPIRFNLQSALRQTIAADDSTPQTQAETNTHFVGRFKQPQIEKLANLWRTPGIEVPVVVSADGSVDFVGRFTPSRLQLMSGLRQNNIAADFSVAQNQPSTEPPFIRNWFQATRFWNSMVIARGSSFDDSFVPPAPGTRRHSLPYLITVGPLSGR